MTASMPGSSAERHRPLDVLADFGNVALQQTPGGLARARSGVADDKQLADFRQLEPEPLRAQDQQQLVHIRGGRNTPERGRGLMAGSEARRGRRPGSTGVGPARVAVDAS